MRLECILIDYEKNLTNCPFILFFKNCMKHKTDIGMCAHICLLGGLELGQIT